MSKRGAVLAVSSVLTITMLCGCSKLNGYVESNIQSQAQMYIEGTEQYKQYIELDNDGQLNADGTYVASYEETVAPLETTRGTIRVTFAKNAFISCRYYRDEQYADQINTDDCYLMPGDCVYAEVVSVTNPNSNLYNFLEYRVWNYDDEGTKSSTEFNCTTEEKGLILTIPKEYSGTGFSVEPIGQYTDRTINVNAYFIDNNGGMRSLDNVIWDVNGEVFSQNTQISPVDSYTIRCDYSKYADDYYFVSSVPECWYVKDSAHMIVFKESSSTENDTGFSVQMHQYVTLTVVNNTITRRESAANAASKVSDYFERFANGAILSMTKNSNDVSLEESGEKNFEIKTLKVGDVIVIRVAHDYKITGDGVDVGNAVPLGNGYEYTITVPDTSKGIKLIISERNSNADGKYESVQIDNADLILYRADGSQIAVGDELPADKEKITVTIVPHGGYYVSGKNVDDEFKYSKKMKYSEFTEDINKIIDEHPVLKFVSVTLKFEDEAGTAVYTLNGKKITSLTPTVNACVGWKLKIEYTADSGYKISRANWFTDAASNITNNKTKTASLEITADLDGTVITRASFGIQVEKEG